MLASMQASLATKEVGMETTSAIRAAVLHSHCIYCGSDYIVGGSVSIEAGEAWQKIQCDVCERRWTEVYTFSYVEEG